MPHLRCAMLLSGRDSIQERLFCVEYLAISAEIKCVADSEAKLMVDLTG